MLHEKSVLISLKIKMGLNFRSGFDGIGGRRELAAAKKSWQINRNREFRYQMGREKK